jgi:hypothetical protein
MVPQENFRGLPQCRRTALHVGRNQVNGELAQEDVTTQREQNSNEHDGRYRDKQIGDDQPVPQAPNRVPCHPAPQPDTHPNCKKECPDSSEQLEERGGWYKPTGDVRGKKDAEERLDATEFDFHP